MNWTKPTKLLILSTTIALLSACSNPFSLQISTLTPSASLLNRSFDAQGKIALRYPKCPTYRACKIEAFSAKVHWQHQNQADSLSFYDPLGQEVLNIIYHANNNQITLNTQNGKENISQEALAERFGLSLPITLLRQWILSPQLSPNFTYQNWQISVMNWQTNHYEQITLKQKDHYIRLLINQLKTN
ncbi:outer membrane lipoprotein LolB [Suttonella ornithocola]|uniref:Outer-membrane lipoprotein LolB n=1 Tax=Suttonella ornithocola TaxID=279832 RepID=A0A380MPE8_9GAMM|nr:outer membrane lipoprotein LolB [Suttonella ornithocola]SUO93763.1 outer membrane lipoprotein LolB [Suttonella ornithocola]